MFLGLQVDEEAATFLEKTYNHQGITSAFYSGFWPNNFSLQFNTFLENDLSFKMASFLSISPVLELHLPTRYPILYVYSMGPYD